MWIRFMLTTRDQKEAKKKTVSTQPNKKDEAWLDAEEVVLSGDQLEEPAATEAVGSSDQRAVANQTPVKRLAKRETKLPSYLKDFQLN